MKKIDSVRKKAILSFSAPLALAATCLFSLSTSLRAAPLPQGTVQSTASAPASLQTFQEKLPIIQNMVQMGCSNQRIDDARAAIAYSAYQQSNDLLGQLKGDIQKNVQFLNTPTDTVRGEFQARADQNLETAKGQLRAALDQFDYDQHMFQLGKVSGDTVRAEQTKLKQARATAETAGQMPPDSVINEAVQNRVKNTMGSLQQLQAAAQNTATLSNKAEGCYASASNTGGSYANPQMDDKLIMPKATGTTASGNGVAGQGGAN